MNSKSVKGRGKRFLAGFLALLMAVTLLPANVAGVAYAEELDAIETEAADSVVAVDEETEAADGVLEADEETDEPQVNEGESSEDVEPEEDLTVNVDADEEDLALEEAVPELEEAIAVASEEVLEPAEVSAAVVADTTGYVEKTNTAEDTKVRSWTFNEAYFTSKKISGGDITAESDLDGITLNAASASGKVKAKISSSEEDLSINDGGIIDIPIDDDTDAVAIEITLQSNNKARYMIIGAGTKKETVYHSTASDGAYVTGSPYFDSNKFYTNATLYKKDDGMFSNVLSIEGKVSENKIASIVLHEYKEAVEPVDLTGANVDLSVGEDDNKAATAVYTGEPIDLNVVVTKTAADDTTTTVNPKAYTKSFLRETDTTDDYAATEDLTSAGKIKVKVTSIHEEVSARSEAESNVFTITPATLKTSDKEVSIDAGQISEYASAELDVATLITPLSDKDTFAYTLDTDAQNGYVAGDVVTGIPTISADGKLTYAVDQNATTASTATVLVVKVESKNYADAYIKVTVAIANKTAVTVSGNSVTHTYNGAAYGFKENAVITVTGASGEALNDAVSDIKENLNYKFTKVVNGTPDASTETTSEPTVAGVYKVTATLSDDSDYTMTQYYEDADTGYVTLTIAPKTVTIKPNDATWDKTLKNHPTAKTSTEVETTDYAFVGDGLVGNDPITTKPAIKYCKHDTTDEMTETDWDELNNGDVVDIVASGADAGSNYNIEYAVGTLTVLVRNLTPIDALTAQKSTFLASDITADVAGDKLQTNADNASRKDVKGDVLVNGFLVTGDTDNFTTLDPSGVTGGSPAVAYTARLKSGSSGNQYYKSIGFTIDKAANLYIVAAADSSNDNRKMKLSKLNAETKALEECGETTKYSRNVANFTSYDLSYAAGGIELDKTTSNKKSDYLNIELTEAGTYYLAAAASGIVFYEVTVTYKNNEDDDKDYTITIDESKIATGGATVTEGSKKTAKANDTVALADVATVSVNTGFELKGWEVKAGNETVEVSAGNTFTMPASNVTVAPIVMAEGAVVAPVAKPGNTAQATEVEKGSKVTLEVAGNDFDHIYYTTGATVADAADPKVDSTARKDYAVDSPTGIEINEDVTIKAVAAKGEKFSDVVTYSYTVKETQTPGTVELKNVKIKGTARVGNTLTAEAEFEGTPEADKVVYAWSRVSSDGTETPVGNNSDTYTVVEADSNCSIKVVVTFTNAEGQKVTKDATVTVTESNVKGNGIEIEFDEGTTYIYTGAKITPSITVYNNGTPLVEGTDYTVKYTNNVNASHKVESDGTTLTATVANDKKLPTVTVTGKGSLSKKVSETFEIVPKALDKKDDYSSAANEVDEVKADAVVVVSGKKATPVLLYGGTKLAVKKNFTYKNTEDQAKKTWADGDKLLLEGANNFTGEIELDVYVVEAAAQKDAKISAKFVDDKTKLNSLFYTGEEITPAIEVSTKTKEASALTLNTDYVISYPSDAINVGSKKVIITGISKDCIGTATLSYKIKPADKTGGTFKVDGVDTVNGYDYVSTGVTFDLTGEDAITVKYVTNSSNNTDARAVSADGESLVPGKDFKITYSNNKKAGTAKYTVTGLGNYKGVVLKNQEFTINPIKLIDGENTGIDVTVADVLYNKSTTYKSVPYVTVNGALLKASEYEVYYIVGTGDNASETKAKTRKITDEDVASGSLEVTVKIVPKAKSKNVAGPAENSQEAALTETFDIIKSDTLTKDKDLSKAKVTFYGGDTKNKVGFTGEAVYPTKMEIKPSGGTAFTVDLVNGQLSNADKATYGFTLSYSDNVAKGKATVVVTADGTSYVGGKAGTFSIVPKALDSLDTANGEGFITSFIAGLFNK